MRISDFSVLNESFLPELLNVFFEFDFCTDSARGNFAKRRILGLFVLLGSVLHGWYVGPLHVT
jgi:hypothetical protein